MILAQIEFGPVYQKEIYWKSWPTLHWPFIPRDATYFQKYPQRADLKVA